MRNEKEIIALIKKRFKEQMIHHTEIKREDNYGMSGLDNLNYCLFSNSVMLKLIRCVDTHDSSLGFVIEQTKNGKRYVSGYEILESGEQKQPKQIMNIDRKSTFSQEVIEGLSFAILSLPTIIVTSIKEIKNEVGRINQ